METDRERGGRFQAFLAILYYEFLWNIRKKKTIGLFLIVFAVATLELALPPLLSNYLGQPFRQDPSFVFNSVSVLTGILIFLLAVSTTMNTVSGEFESGSIIPLLTKPVSKTLVFAGKVVAAFLTLLGVYAFLALYILIGGVLIQGPQDNLQLVPLGLLGLTMATMVWASIVIALGTVSKNSVVAALGSFGLYIGLTIVGSLLAAFLGQSSLLFYTPGDGATGSTGSCTGLATPTSRFGGGRAVLPTGTNALGLLVMEWVLNPDLTLNFCGFRFARGVTETYLLSAEPISMVALRALSVSLSYIVILLLVGWFAFRRTQITE